MGRLLSRRAYRQTDVQRTAELVATAARLVYVVMLSSSTSYGYALVQRYTAPRAQALVRAPVLNTRTFVTRSEKAMYILVRVLVRSSILFYMFYLPFSHKRSTWPRQAVVFFSCIGGAIALHSGSSVIHVTRPSGPCSALPGTCQPQHSSEATRDKGTALLSTRYLSTAQQSTR